jgi:hypothetical protein
MATNNVWFWLFFAVVLLFGFVVFRGAPYVPTRRKYLIAAFSKLYILQPDDVLVDVGSGDGRVMRLAASKVKRAVGYELNPALVFISRLLSRRQQNVETRLADFWLAKLPDDITIVYAFSVSRDIKKLTQKLSREATRTGHEIKVITYGAGIDALVPDKSYQAFKLYTIHPLQPAGESL